MNEFIKKFVDVIINPLILLLFAFASLLFVYGLFEYIRNTESSEGRQKGARHIMYSIIGFVIIFSVFGIINIITNTFNIPNPLSNQ